MKLKELKERSREIRAQYEGKYHVKWPDNFKKDVIRLLENGESMVKICKATGIAHQTIDHWREAPPFNVPIVKIRTVSQPLHFFVSKFQVPEVCNQGCCVV